MQQDQKYYMIRVPGLDQLLKLSDNMVDHFLDTYPVYTNFEFDVFTDRVTYVYRSFSPTHASLRKYAILKGIDTTCYVVITKYQCMILKKVTEDNPNIDIEIRPFNTNMIKDNRECTCVIL